MKIQLITPAPASAKNGNRITAIRWARILRRLGHRLVVRERYNGAACDLMIALHAHRSFDSIHDFRRRYPKRPLAVVLTGTDLYRDIRTRARARESLEAATRIVVLQPKALEELPRRLRRKTRVIYQSAAKVRAHPRQIKNGFQVCVIGHLRREKDPLRTALAARSLPLSSRVSLVHIGRALTPDMESQARREVSRNPRYRWLGELPHRKTRRLLAASHLLSLTSRMEGSSNVLSEAIASSVPVVAAKIPGLIGTLGETYPGYFQVGKTAELARLLHKAESDLLFYGRLKSYCARLQPLVDPKREQAALKKLVRELSQSSRRRG